MDILLVTELIGIASFALSGFLAAVRHKFDILGIILLSYITALGGGILRDVIANKTPYSLSDPYPSLIVFIVIFLSLLFKLSKKQNIERKNLFVLSDSIGLISFSITGALIGIEAEFNFFGIVILALITAIGGGIIRDTLVNKVPSILKEDFYATVSIITATLIYLLNIFENLSNTFIVIVFVTTLFVRLLAYKFKWKLPSV